MPYRFEDFEGRLPAFLDQCGSAEVREAIDAPVVTLQRITDLSP